MSPTSTDVLGQSADETSTTSEYHALLSSERRKFALSVLVDCDGCVSLDDVASEVAAMERRDGCATDGGDERTVAITLHHIHLPKLDAAGLITYDHDANEVVETPTDEAI
ncbi:DUF7344 domain-containing protein [Halobaculum litoreum]|uniref:DUF7344 domain-containing protein n=1 Tax=Halobaculum litoreum TaxID=3031998 RepID=A0ABD5XVQ0_9EURY|nr:hypothetical protein [Halobaculum sp. DT92]